MKKPILLLGLGLLLAVGSAQAQQVVPGDTAIAIPKNMRQYFVAFLVKPPGQGMTEVPADLARRHLAYIRAMIQQKKYVVAGPFLDNDRIAGMVVVAANTLEEAQRIVTGDPTVMEGLLQVEVHPAMLPDLGGVVVQY